MHVNISMELKQESLLRISELVVCLNKALKYIYLL
jgi:hypothetical protein